jgi:hypothetical protein
MTVIFECISSKFEEAKGEIRPRKSRKNKQYDDKRNKKTSLRKIINNDLQNTTQKSND